jgi:DNA-binding NarL/FixJ family response regulator
MPPPVGRAEPRSPFDERERIVLSLIHEGLGISEIAELLGVSEETVGEIIQAVIEKLKDV